MASKKKGEERSESGTTSHSNDLGIVAVVFGILSVFSFSAGGVVMGIIGLVFATKQKKKHHNKWSKAGIALNIIGIILGIIGTILIIFFFNDQLTSLGI